MSQKKNSERESGRRPSRPGRIRRFIPKPGLFSSIIIIVAGVGFAYIGGAAYYGSKTIYDLLGENKRLKQYLTNLTQENEIGYAKVLKQEEKDGRLFTTLKFAQTERDNPSKVIQEKVYTIEGNIIHFDALIVKFSDQMVMDGKDRSLFIWRRVYGEKDPPEKGLPIEKAGAEPVRYQDLMKHESFWDKIDVLDKIPFIDELPINRFSPKDRDMFWKAVWELANNPEKLKDYGIKAIYGNVTYTQLKPGLVYVFKINNQGQVYPEVIPDI